MALRAYEIELRGVHTSLQRERLVFLPMRVAR
jgi:hypothetical protein